VLSQAEIDSFTADGYVAVRGAVPVDVLRRCQDEIWSTPRPGRTRDGTPGSWPSPAWPCTTRSRWSRPWARSSSRCRRSGPP